MKKSILFLLCSILFCACHINTSNEFDYYVNESINVKDFRWKEDILICVIDDTDGMIIFDNDKVFTFKNINEKQIVNFEKIKIMLIPEKPFLIITYDDAPDCDYDVYQTHKLYEPIIAAEIGIIMSGVGISNEKLIEMCTVGGWEPVCHSYSHTRFERLRLQRKYKKGDNKIYGWFVHTFMDGNEINIGDENYTIISHSSDSEGNFFVVEPNLIKDYDASSFVQISENQLNLEMTKNIEKFYNETNLKIKHFTWPYTVSDSRTQATVSKFFYSSRAYNGKNSDDTNNLVDGGLNYYPFENLYTLNSANYVQYYSNDEILTMIAKAKSSNALMIQFAHTWDANFSTSKLVFLIDNALKEGVQIVTRSDIFDYYELW